MGITLWKLRIAFVACVSILACLLASAMASEIPAGTHFLVELNDKLEAKKIKVGKKFEARTLEGLKASDGTIIPADAKLKGRVSSVDHGSMVLRFERIETRHGKLPIVATVTALPGEKHITTKAGEEGEIHASRSREKGALTGAAVGAGAGAAAGAATGGKKGAVLGSAIGAAAGTVIGLAIGRGDLVLVKGTRLELELDRPLVFEPRR